MHSAAMQHGKEFFAKYLKWGDSIVEIGSAGGGLSSAVPEGCYYFGVDCAPGVGVDAVMSDPYVFPITSGSFDCAVATSTFEHVEFFWLTFLEMVRVVRIGGYIYNNAPSNGPYHGYPQDCWRFYVDSVQALTRWAVRNGYELEQLEQFVGEPSPDGGWMDCVGVWRRVK